MKIDKSVGLNKQRLLLAKYFMTHNDTSRNYWGGGVGEATSPIETSLRTGVSNNAG